MLAAGCIADPVSSAKIDPSSPVAADVARMARADADFPSFREMPAISKDNRPVRAYGEAASELKVAAAELERLTAPGTWTLSGTTGFADRARRDAGPQIAPPTPSDAEAFARELRERAIPPPRR